MYLHASQESSESRKVAHKIHTASNSILLQGPMKIEEVLEKILGVLGLGHGGTRKW